MYILLESNSEAHEYLRCLYEGLTSPLSNRDPAEQETTHRLVSTCVVTKRDQIRAQTNP
jgi:hypothetical protein